MEDTDPEAIPAAATPATPSRAMPKQSPIAQAVGSKLTEEHLTRLIDVGEKLVDKYTQRGHEISKLSLWLNYGVIVVVVGVLAWLNMRGTMPAEALTGFLGTGIGYWLATSFQGSD